VVDDQVNNLLLGQTCLSAKSRQRHIVPALALILQVVSLAQPGVLEPKVSCQPVVERLLGNARVDIDDQRLVREPLGPLARRLFLRFGIGDRCVVQVTQRRALVLADNRLAMSAGWDEAMLRVELESLQEDAFNLDLVGFTDEELEEFLREPESTQDGLTDPDAVPAEQDAIVTVRGDVWVLDQHRLLCGDATQMADIEKVLAGGLADMVFTDPPYNVAYEGKTAKKLTIDNDALGGKFYEFLRDASANMLAMTKGAIYMCMSSSELHTLFRAFTDAGGHWSTFVIWAKHHFTLGRSDYQRMYEPILYGWRKGTEHFWCGDRNQGDVWSIKRPMANLEHPTMKPVELVERALRNSSKTRDTILDPFGGSGTTLIACEKTQRQARLIELEPKYCDVIIRRWQEFTGQEAKLEADGRSYSDVAKERTPVAA
jgi:DNA modification methylase